MSENRTRKWPAKGYNEYLSSEESERAKFLFEKYDYSLEPPYVELNEEDATLYVAWLTGLSPLEARWSVLKERGQIKSDDGTVDVSQLNDEELRAWAGSEEDNIGRG